MADGFDEDMTRCPCCDGEGYFYHGDEPKSPWGDAATIARLTAERDQALAEAAAAYERAAQVADHYSDADYCAMGYPEEGGIAASGTADAIRRDIRALATDPGTTALAEMLDAETRACAQIVREKRAGLVGIGVERAILARLDQRKEAA